MRAMPVAAVLVVMAAFAPSAARACGACAEDKVAATYDHGVVSRAAASGDVMVFCEVTGPLDARRLKEVVRRVRGVKAQSVRISVQPATMSFAVDPGVRSPQAAVQEAQRGLTSGTRLAIVQLRGPPDDPTARRAARDGFSAPVRATAGARRP
ncbi:hypothetical protein HLB44_09915 [Aquincola sp. S2]|uniref:HMA domain-containing protein n=1 Tax=Pseudaquabacterium terrae TaxID=2732868 RepID=A0ABX2EFB3_9BURK|nr:hypothetical protein [Aquabacterium terrae]NRF67299.1 hypothetical protein [Aquabacterium terrae]